MTELEQKVRADLFEMQDLKYRGFTAKLTPTVVPENIIGVRTPELRKYAREMSKTPAAAEFMAILPHKYYEEYNLHGFLIERISDFDEAISQTERFLPFVDNWATCDLVSPKVFGKHLPELYEKIKEWVASGSTYTVRFGLEMLMSYYLGDKFLPEYALIAAGVRSEEYYVNMMVAWFFATALAKQYDAILPFFEQKRLEKWVHNKALQKATESYRITPEQKAQLRALKIK